MMQASKIKSFDVAMDEGFEGRRGGGGGEPAPAFKTSLSMSNIMQHQADQERLRKKLKKQNKKMNKMMKASNNKKANSKKSKKQDKKKALLLAPHDPPQGADQVEQGAHFSSSSTLAAATRSLAETGTTSTEEIGTTYDDSPATTSSRGGGGQLSRSSPTPTAGRLRSGSCWSDADDEILEFVREETPVDRRSVGLQLLPSSVTTATTASVTTTMTTSTTTTSLSSRSSPAQQQQQPSKKSSKSSKSSKKLFKKDKSSNSSSSSKGRKGSSSSSSLADVMSSGGGSGSGGGGASSHDEVRWDDVRARARADEAVRATYKEGDDDNEEEEEEEGEKDDDEECVLGDTDDESGSCSSRYGWQFKNDKLLTGRDWAELYDNMKRHITTGAPRREFAMLDEDAARVYAKRTDDFSCAVAPLNFQKNRYGNILPYNQNRVKLAVAEDQSDYVNASYVKLDDALPGFHDKITYIAASAPIPSTVEDFYRMLWETETFGIVMLTRNEEGGRPKCHQYWPEENEKHSYGSFAVTNVEEIENRKHSFLVRRFLIEKAGETREITQYHYLAWPDHGVPDSPEPLEEIIKLINAQMRTVVKSNALKEPTLVAHCSAGIGRTGAFILIHTVLNLLFQEIKEDDAESLARWTSKAPPTIDFVHLVQHMRNQRTCMISQPEQYEFCYQTVLSNLGRALHYTPRKSEIAHAKHDSRAARKASLSAIPRQKSCVLF